MSVIKLFSGRANPDLSQAIGEKLGVPLGKISIRTFSDGEVFCEIGESVRGHDCYIVQPTCSPTSENLLELMIILDAFKRASAGSISAVMPYYGYARQDRKVSPRSPISAKLVADMLATAGATRVVSVDLHAGQIQGFFNIPVDHLYSTPVLTRYLKTRYGNEDLVVVSPDAGGVERARAVANRLGASLAIVDKRRSAPNEAKAYHLIGEVKDKMAVVVDDMIDTAGTLCQAAELLMREGARGVVAAATHPVFSGPAAERIRTTDALKAVIVTDTIPLRKDLVGNPKVTVLSVAELLAEAISRIHRHESVSSLFV